MGVFSSAVFAFLSLALLADSAFARNRLPKWIVSPRLFEEFPERLQGDYPAGHGKAGVEIRVLQRFARDTRGRPYPVATITRTRVPKNRSESGHTLGPKLAKTVLEAMGLHSWAVEALGQATAYRGEWMKGGRILELFVREDPRTITYTVASMRSGYARRVDREVDLVQRALLDLDTRSARAPGFLFPEAHAGPAGLGVGAIRSLNQSLKDANQNLGDLTDTLGDTNATIQTESPAWRTEIDEANDNVDGVIRQSKQWGNRYDDTLSTIQGVTTQAGQYFSRAMEKYDETLRFIEDANTTWNDNFDQAMALVDEKFSPGYAALVGAAGVLGGSLASVGFSLAADGIALLWDGLKEMITHAKKKAELLAAFKAARELYEKQKPVQVAMETALDAFLAALEEQKALETSSGLAPQAAGLPFVKRLALAHLVELRERQKGVIAGLNYVDTCQDAEAAFAWAGTIEPALQGYIAGVRVLCRIDPTQLGALDQKLLADSRVAPAIRKACEYKDGKDEDFSYLGICGRAEAFLEGLRKVENSLEEARKAIIGGADVYATKDQRDRIRESFGASEDARKRAGRLPSANLANLGAISRKKLKELRKEFAPYREKFMLHCLANCVVAGYSDRYAKHEIEYSDEECDDQAGASLVDCLGFEGQVALCGYKRTRELATCAEGKVADLIRDCRADASSYPKGAISQFEFCFHREGGNQDFAPPAAECIKEADRVFQRCKRPRARYSNEFTGDLKCYNAVGTTKDSSPDPRPHWSPSVKAAGYLSNLCEAQFEERTNEGKEYTRLLAVESQRYFAASEKARRAKDERAGGQERHLRTETAPLYEAATELQEFSDWALRESLGHQDKLDALAEKGRRIEAVCGELKKREADATPSE